MIQFFSAVLLSISANLDNILIGISYGSHKKKIPLHYILIIGLIISFVTLISCIVGEYILNKISTSLSNIIGSLSLIIIGIITLICMKKTDEKNEIKPISLKNAIILGITLSLNNFAISLAGGINGVNEFYLIIFNGVFSVIFLLFGNILGRRINAKIIGIITSIILILIGVYEYLI